MDWKKPIIHDLSNLKKSVAQGACASGASVDPICNVGVSAASCTEGGDADTQGPECSAGSAVE